MTSVYLVENMVLWAVKPVSREIVMKTLLLCENWAPRFLSHLTLVSIGCTCRSWSVQTYNYSKKFKARLKYFKMRFSKFYDLMLCWGANTFWHPVIQYKESGSYIWFKTSKSGSNMFILLILFEILSCALFQWVCARVWVLTVNKSNISPVWNIHQCEVWPELADVSEMKAALI